MPAQVQLPTPRVEGHTEPVATAFLGDGSFTQMPQEHVGTINSAVANDSSRMIAGNVVSNTSISGNVRKIEIYDYGRVHGGHASQPVRVNHALIQRWLASSDQRSIQEAIMDQRSEDTGSWLFDGKDIESWIKNEKSFLWLHGGVGCGKTFLISSIIQKLHQVMYSLCYFFFSFQDGARGDLKALLYSLISQMCNLAGDNIPTPILELYHRCHQSLPRNPALHELKSAVFATLQCLDDKERSGQTPKLHVSNNSIYFVIDALDEVSWSERNDLLNFLQAISEHATSNLHVLVASRNEPDIVDAFSGAKSRWKGLEIPTVLVDKDIERYITKSLESHKSLKRRIESHDLIRQKLVREANGMFRWSALQLSALKRLRTPTARTIENALKTLPSDLNKTYANILNEIDKELRPQAMSALQWLVAAKRPLHVEELADACSESLGNIEESTSVFKGATLEPYTIFEMLRDLVTIQPTLPEEAAPEPRCHVIALAHFSVQEFLQQDGTTSTAAQFMFSSMQAHAKVARDCLIYLYRFNTPMQSNGPKKRPSDFPLREYAWFNWEKHVLPVAGDEASADPARKKATQLYAHFKEHSWFPMHDGIAAHERSGLISWLPQPDGKPRLLDALNMPYFYPKIERYFAPISDAPPEDLRWFGERRPDPLKREIALISLLPALDPDTDIRCLLHLVRLDDSPSFKAISYALGPDEHYPVYVGGARKSVRPQLAAIFKHLRLHQEYSTPFFWADVISLEEWQSYRSRYERRGVYYTETRFLIMLKEIFEAADEVTIGLGEEREGDGEAIALVHRIGELAHAWRRDNRGGEEEGGVGSIAVDSELYRAISMIERAGGWHILMSLLDREWWSRRWVLQEVVVAKTATLFFGNRAFSFNALDAFVQAEGLIKAIIRQIRGGPFGLAYHDVFDSREWTVARDVALTRREYQVEPVDLKKLLWRFRFQKATYKTDMIRTLIGMSYNIDTSYSGSTSHVEVDLFRKDLQDSLFPAVADMFSNDLAAGLDILSFNSIYSVWPENFDAEEIPATWLPTLERDATDVVPLILGTFGAIHNTPDRLYNACGPHTLDHMFEVVKRGDDDYKAWDNIKGIIEGRQEKTLSARISIKGFEIDHVCRVAEPYLGDVKDSNQLLSHAKRMAELAHSWYDNHGDTSSNDESMSQTADMPPPSVDTIWLVILADRFELEPPFESRIPRDKNPGLPFPLPPTAPEEVDEFLQVPATPKALRYLYGRRLFTTKNGRLGLGPCGMRQGDVVAIFGGGSVPYVLHRMDKMIKKHFICAPLWRFVGECYVHGVMDGELFRDTGDLNQDNKEGSSEATMEEDYFVLEGEEPYIPEIRPWKLEENWIQSEVYGGIDIAL